MGTNYEAIAASGTRIHLGKQSAGWPFLFHAEDVWAEHDVWKEWFSTLVSCRIENEYGDDVEPAELMEKIINSYRQYRIIHHRSFLSGPGFQFMRGEFC